MHLHLSFFTSTGWWLLLHRAIVFGFPLSLRIPGCDAEVERSRAFLISALDITRFKGSVLINVFSPLNGSSGPSMIACIPGVSERGLAGDETRTSSGSKISCHFVVFRRAFKLGNTLSMVRLKASSSIAGRVRVRKALHCSKHGLLFTSLAICVLPL